MKMRLTKLASILLVFVAVLTLSLTSTAQKTNNQPRPETIVVGFISDNMCGLNHMSGMGDEKSCTLGCVKGGAKFVLADRNHKRVYNLDQAGQEKARDFAGQKVKVTGRISGKTIRVTAIEAAG
jgi:hypothetical protein